MTVVFIVLTLIAVAAFAGGAIQIMRGRNESEAAEETAADGADVKVARAAQRKEASALRTQRREEKKTARNEKRAAANSRRSVKPTKVRKTKTSPSSSTEVAVFRPKWTPSAEANTPHATSKTPATTITWTPPVTDDPAPNIVSTTPSPAADTFPEPVATIDEETVTRDPAILDTYEDVLEEGFDAGDEDGVAIEEADLPPSDAPVDVDVTPARIADAHDDITPVTEAHPPVPGPTFDEFAEPEAPKNTIADAMSARIAAARERREKLQSQEADAKEREKAAKEEQKRQRATTKTTDRRSRLQERLADLQIKKTHAAAKPDKRSQRLVNRLAEEERKLHDQLARTRQQEQSAQRAAAALHTLDTESQSASWESLSDAHEISRMRLKAAADSAAAQATARTLANEDSSSKEVKVVVNPFVGLLGGEEPHADDDAGPEAEELAVDIPVMDADMDLTAHDRVVNIDIGPDAGAYGLPEGLPPRAITASASQ